jgi:tRNA threonylcarbamoyladenosine biosynthesis protein TsaB
LSILFVDSTYDITLGLLDDGLRWVDFRRHFGMKASTVIQKEASDILETFNLNPEKLSAVVSVNGPGFYTGLRLSEGFSDVFGFFGVPTYAFYSYEIPRWCGVKTGSWFTRAYRGEYFLYHWDLEESGSVLLGSKELPDRLLPGVQYYVHSESSLDEQSLRLLTRPVSTVELLKSNPELVFDKVLKNKLKREIFYFRAPEEEFKANP